MLYESDLEVVVNSEFVKATGFLLNGRIYHHDKLNYLYSENKLPALCICMEYMSGSVKLTGTAVLI